MTLLTCIFCGLKKHYRRQRASSISVNDVIEHFHPQASLLNVHYLQVSRPPSPQFWFNSICRQKNHQRDSTSYNHTWPMQSSSVAAQRTPPITSTDQPPAYEGMLLIFISSTLIGFFFSLTDLYPNPTVPIHTNLNSNL